MAKIYHPSAISGVIAPRQTPQIAVGTTAHLIVEGLFQYNMFSKNLASRAQRQLLQGISAARQARSFSNKIPLAVNLTSNSNNIIQRSPVQGQNSNSAVQTSGRFQRYTIANNKREFSSSGPSLHGHVHKPKPGEELHVTFITKEGEQLTFEVAEGDTLLDIAQANNLDMEGACGGSCACSTCHVIVDPDFYDLTPEPDDDENDMLDLAFGLTETSRLGCQVRMTKEIDGIRVALPAMTRNLQTKDFD